MEYAIIYAEVAMFVFFCTSVDRRLYIYNIVLSTMECVKVGEEWYLLFITCSGLLQCSVPAIALQKIFSLENFQITFSKII